MKFNLYVCGNNIAMKGIIYKATNTLSGMVYIGQTVAGLSKRRMRHLQDSKSDWRTNYFHFHLHQCPSAFKWEVLDEFNGADDYVLHSLNVAEEYWIIKCNSTDPKYGYNSTQGGYSSDVFAKHIRKRMNVTNGAKVFLQYSLDGTFIKEYPSLNSICAEFGCVKLKESGLLKPSWRGFIWKRKESEVYPLKIEGYTVARKPMRKVVKYDFNGDKMCIYDGVCEAKRQNPVSIVHSPRSVIVIREKDFRKSILVNYGFVGDVDTPEHISVKLVFDKPKQPSKPQMRRVISVFNLDGDFEGCYDSPAAAARFTGCCDTTIKRSIGMSLPYILDVHNQSRYIFREGKYGIGDRIEVIRKERKPKVERQIKVLQYTLDGEFVKGYLSISDASVESGDSYCLIRKMCMGGLTKKSTKYQWRYASYQA